MQVNGFTKNIGFKRVNFLDLAQYAVYDRFNDTWKSKYFRDSDYGQLAEDFVVNYDLGYVYYEPVTHYKYIGEIPLSEATDEQVLINEYVEQIIGGFGADSIPLITGFGTIPPQNIITDKSDVTTSGLYLYLSDGSDGIYNEILNIIYK